MKNLRFKQLELISNSRKSGSQFKFQEKLNLITGNDNDIGKSSLVKSIFWVLGCEPYFDDDWKSVDCKGILDFSIGEDLFSVARYKDVIYLKEGAGSFVKYTKTTGDYAAKFAKLVNFSALLPSRAKGEEVARLQVPPPAYYFLPYYLDQKKTWSHPWSGFSNLGQYANWQQTIIKYHTGYLGNEHFDIEDSIYDAKYLEGEANIEIDRINKALSVVNEYSSEFEIILTETEYEEAKIEIDEGLKSYCDRQEKILEKIAGLRGDKQYLFNQLSYAKQAVKELELDYSFAVENLDGEHVECPVCGTEHDNSIVSRSSLLVDKQGLEVQLKELEFEYETVQSHLVDAEEEIKFIRSEINRIEDKYILRPGDGGGASFIDAISARTVKNNVGKALGDKQSISKEQSDNQKGFKKDQRNLITKKDREILDSDFINYLTKYVNKLNAGRVNISNVKRPTDYNKVYENGGAAHSSRAVLAYYLAVYSQGKKHGLSVNSPLVVDTPNQHEQTDFNYESIVKLLVDDTLGDGQIILCAMNNEALEPFYNSANIITLSDEQLFRKSDYHKLKDRFEQVFSE